MKKKVCKFDIKDLLPIGMIFIVFGIAISYGLDVFSEMRSDLATEDCAGYWNDTSLSCQVSSTNATVLSGNTESVNASSNAIEGVSKLPEKLPLIATVVIAAVIIGILVTYLAGRFMR